MHNKGAVVAVDLGWREALTNVSQLQKCTVYFACANGPVSTIISVDDAAIDELNAVLDDKVFA